MRPRKVIKKVVRFAGFAVVIISLYVGVTLLSALNGGSKYEDYR